MTIKTLTTGLCAILLSATRGCHGLNVKKAWQPPLPKIDALPGETFEGTVSRYSAELDSQTRMMRVEMDLENGAELSLDAEKSRLKPGFFGYATVHFNE